MGLAFNELWEEGAALLFALINCGYKFLSGLWCFRFIFRVVEMSRTLKENQQSFLLAMSFMLKSYMNLYTNDHANTGSCSVIIKIIFNNVSFSLFFYHFIHLPIYSSLFIYSLIYLFIFLLVSRFRALIEIPIYDADTSF